MNTNKTENKKDEDIRIGLRYDIDDENDVEANDGIDDEIVLECIIVILIFIIGGILIKNL